MDRRQPHPIRLDRHGRYVGRRERDARDARRAGMVRLIDGAVVWLMCGVGVVLAGGALGFAAFTLLASCRRGE